MSKVINVDITPDTWVNVNTLTGISVGTEFRIQNDGVIWVRIQESSTQPTENKEGKILTNLDKSSSSATITSGSETLWARSSIEGRSGSLAVQEATP